MRRQQDLPAAQFWAALAQLCLLVAARCELMEQSLLAPVADSDLHQPGDIDRTLQGYLPLQAVHQQLDFSGPKAADEVSVSCRLAGADIEPCAAAWARHTLKAAASTLCSGLSRDLPDMVQAAGI